MEREIARMLRAREDAERVRGNVPPRPRLSRDAVVEFRPLLNAPALQEITRTHDVNIIVFDTRATQHVLKRCQEQGIETMDARQFRLEGGMERWMPRHTLLAPKDDAKRWMEAHYPHILPMQLPWLLHDDPAALYHGCEVGEIWAADEVGDGEEFGGAFPPRIVVEAPAQ